jgi:hypothetical protein
MTGYSHDDFTSLGGVRYAHFSFDSHNIEREVPELHERRPDQDKLWHYTSGSSLTKIIESGELWSTQVACLNSFLISRAASEGEAECLQMFHAPVMSKTSQN